MAELLNANDKRTHYCGTVRECDIGKEVCVMGWVQRQRDTVQRTLGDLLKNGEITKIGGGRYTSYIWNGD